MSNPTGSQASLASEEGGMLSEARASEPSSVMPASAHDHLLLLALQEQVKSQLQPATATATTTAGPAGVLSALSQTTDVSYLWNMLFGMHGIAGQNELGPTSHPLWQNNMCAWHNCNQPCETLSEFLLHLQQAHGSDETAANDLRSQVEMVDSLEQRLTKERNRLQAMMQHIHLRSAAENNPPPQATKSEPMSPIQVKQEPTPTSTLQFNIDTSQPNQMGLISEAASMSLQTTSSEASPNADSKPFVPRRSRISDKSVMPIAADIAKNRHFYRLNDVRPPYTYASLIRQAIMESPECQLTLNEIYTWFTETFAYFRRNAATWKNAVRHNLSLHKCFQRVEQNVKGVHTGGTYRAVWTVDDSEFYRRRPQRTNNPNKSQGELSQMSSPSLMGLGGSEGHAETLNGGLEGVLSLLAANAEHQNPLHMLATTTAGPQEHPFPLFPKTEPETNGNYDPRGIAIEINERNPLQLLSQAAFQNHADTSNGHPLATFRKLIGIEEEREEELEERQENQSDGGGGGGGGDGDGDGDGSRDPDATPPMDESEMQEPLAEESYMNVQNDPTEGVSISIQPDCIPVSIQNYQDC